MMIHQFRPAPTSGSHSDKRLPELPEVTPDISSGDDGPGPSEVVSEGDGARSVPKLRVHIPQFRQSKRWARNHGWAEQSVPLLHPHRCRDSILDDNPTPEEVRSQLLSKREVSFEQQRAVQKQPLFQRPSPIAESEQPSCDRTISDGCLDLQNDSSTRTSTAECWRFVRPTIIRLPRANTTSWPRRRTNSSRKAAPSRRREYASRRSSAVLSLPSAENKDHLQKRNSAASNRATSESSHQRRTSLKRRSYRQNEGWARRNMTTPFIPLLHDPSKTGNFGDQWREMLKDIESEKESSLPVTSTSITDMEGITADPILPSKSLDPTEEIARKRVSSGRQSRRRLSKQGEGSGRGEIMSGPVPSSAALQSQEPLDQDPSVVIRNLGSMLQAGQTQQSALAQIGVVPGFDQNQHQTAAPLSLIALQNLRTRSMKRLASAKSAMSTDTLTSIEAQVQNERTWVDLGPLKEVIEKPTSHAVYRRSGPPPKIPLPALPAEAQDDQSDVSRISEDSDGMPSRRQSSASSEEFARRLIQGPRADKVRAQILRDLGQSPKQSPKSGSQAEAKQNVPQLTAEADVKSPTPVSTFLVDLARFPAVPDSRPTSMGSSSARSTHALQQSSGKVSVHTLDRASTDSSAGHPLQPQHHVLSQSNIFVVVDSDPVTACFRASVGGNSPERRSSAYPTKPAKLKEPVVHQTCPADLVESKTALQSPRGRQGLTVRLPVADNKRPAISDARHQSSSSDERSLRKTDTDSLTQKPSRNKKRRRWNSSDISLIKLLQRDLEEYYAKIREQEEKIKWQAYQIQMMNRGFAPMSRSPGVQAPATLQDSPELSPMASEAQPVHFSKNGSWASPKERRQRNVGARSPLSIIKEQTLNTQPQVGSRGEAFQGEMEAVPEGAGKSFTILQEPIALIENEANMAESRYYRP